ncbi:hypothetical protein VUR80DRAFT_7022 [Thermomyces stellatus]
MKIKTLSRSAVQPAGSDVQKLPRNLNPEVHPFERAREYTRALNAVKLERMFAKPFVGQLGGGHVEGVYSMAVDGQSLHRAASASADGVVKVWDLSGRDEIWHATAHENIVRGLCWTNTAHLISCASDKTIKLWDPYNTASDSEPVATWLGSSGFNSISHHRNKNAFAVASDVISIYDLERPTAAPEVIAWPNRADTINSVAFNQVETSVIASCASDRSVILYDVRSSIPVTKTILNFACNAVAWNPMEAYNFALGSENHDVMIFDSRNMSRALNVLKDHVAAVMDVQFSPTGEELVSASYDRTLRIWRRDQGHSRDIYHTKRMQRLFAARWTPDSKYILSGSDDGNVRIWKANASKTEGPKSAKQRQALEYNDALIARYGHMPEVRRIKRHRHLPKVVKKAQSIKREELNAIKRREENERKHSSKQFQKRRPEREKMVLAMEE